MLKRDITVTFAGNLVATILSLGDAVILARVLGPTNRGALGLALFIPSITATFCILGQETVNTTFAGLYKDKRAGLFEQSLIITLFGTVVSTLVICAFYFWLPIERGQFNQLTPDIIWLSCLITPIALLGQMTIALVRGVGQIAAAAFIHVMQVAALLALLVIFLLWRDGGLRTALLLWALAPLVTVVLSIWVLRDYVTLRPSNFSAWLFKKSLIFGGQIGLATFSTFLVYRIDQGILAYMVPTHQLGLYITAVALAERLRLLPNSIATAFLPRLANELPSRQLQVPMVFRGTAVVSAGSMFLVGILGVPAVLVLFGWDYSGAIPSFLLLLPGIASLGGSSILASDLIARGKPKYGIWTGYATLAINIAFNLALIPLIGIAGAAVSSSVSYIAATVLWLFFYWRESKTSLYKMIPTLEDVKYVFAGVVSVIRQIIVLSNAKLKSIDFIGARKR